MSFQMPLQPKIIPEDIDPNTGLLFNQDEMAFIKQYIAENPGEKKLFRTGPRKPPKDPIPPLKLKDGRTLDLRYSVSMFNGVPHAHYIGKEKMGKMRALGKGMFGSVKLSQNLETGELRAQKTMIFDRKAAQEKEAAKKVKRSPLKKDPETEFREHFENEVKIEEKILGTGKGSLLRETSDGKLKGVIIMTVAKGSDLFDYINLVLHDSKQFTFENFLNISIGLAQDLKKIIIIAQINKILFIGI